MLNERAKTAETAVIIPSFNGLGFLEACIPALLRQSYTDFRVIVIDNGSADGTKTYLDTLSDRVESIILKQNLGFAAAVNIGIEHAGDQRFVVLLNNDTVPDSDYLKELLRPLRDDEGCRIASVTPLMLKLSDPGIIDDAGDGYNLLGFAFQRGVGQDASGARFGKASLVTSSCAGAAAYRLKALKEIASCGKVFDEAHFAYLEDVDVSMRLRLHGYEIVYAPLSRVLHVGSGTSGSKYNEFKVRLSARNNIFLIYKNFPLLLILINLPFFLTGTLIKLIFFMLRGFGGAYIRGVKEGFTLLKSEKERKLKPGPGKLVLYVKLELRLIKDTFTYLRDFMLRRLR